MRNPTRTARAEPKAHARHATTPDARTALPLSLTPTPISPALPLDSTSTRTHQPAQAHIQATRPRSGARLATWDCQACARRAWRQSMAHHRTAYIWSKQREVGPKGPMCPSRWNRRQIYLSKPQCGRNPLCATNSGPVATTCRDGARCGTPRPHHPRTSDVLEVRESPSIQKTHKRSRKGSMYEHAREAAARDEVSNDIRDFIYFRCFAEQNKSFRERLYTSDTPRPRRGRDNERANLKEPPPRGEGE